MTTTEREDIFDFAIATSFLLNSVEDLIDDYENGEIISDKDIDKIKRKLNVVRQKEKNFKKCLGINM